MGCMNINKIKENCRLIDANYSKNVGSFYTLDKFLAEDNIIQKAF